MNNKIFSSFACRLLNGFVSISVRPISLVEIKKITKKDTKRMIQEEIKNGYRRNGKNETDSE